MPRTGMSRRTASRARVISKGSRGAIDAAERGVGHLAEDLRIHVGATREHQSVAIVEDLAGQLLRLIEGVGETRRDDARAGRAPWR